MNVAQKKRILRHVEDYIDELGKDNTMWRESQEDIAYRILHDLEEFLKNENPKA